MNSKLKNDSTDYLFKAILSLENEEDCYRFFEDLCTSAELKAMSQRLVVAKMLTEKKVYTEIISTTIEDLANRKSLLKLEGGEEAFKKRDRKLLSGFVS